MKIGIAIIAILTLMGCNDSKEQPSPVNERFELVPEPDKDLRMAYEKYLADSITKAKHLAGLKDSIVLVASNTVQDEIVNDYLKADLEPIRKNFKRINTLQSWTAIEKIDLRESTEGGEATFYYANDMLEKIMVRHFGEMGQYLVEYYLMNGELSFVFEKTYEYNRPIYWDSTSMKENNDNQVFDFEQSEVFEERNYFLNNRLVHQLSNQDCGAPFSAGYLVEAQAKIHLEFKKIMDLKNKGK